MIWTRTREQPNKQTYSRELCTFRHRHVDVVVVVAVAVAQSMSKRVCYCLPAIRAGVRAIIFIRCAPCVSVYIYYTRQRRVLRRTHTHTTRRKACSKAPGQRACKWCDSDRFIYIVYNTMCRCECVGGPAASVTVTAPLVANSSD